jgi:hypothetical protein
MTPPESFTSALTAQFGGRFRCRWSQARHRWQLEKKVATAILPPAPVDPRNDDIIRAVDGYDFYAEVCPGTTTACEHCGGDMKATIRSFTRTTCERCGEKSIACFWPLTDSLLEQLRSTDPDRGGYRRLKEELAQATIERKRKQLQQRQEAFFGVLEDARFWMHEKVGYGSRKAAR